MGFLEELDAEFGTQDLYAVLGIKDKSCTPGIIKTAYYKSSLKWHPDRVNENDKQKATTKFQLLGKAYCVLSDKERKSVYDETGDTGEDGYTMDDLEGNDWTAYWRAMFKQVTVADIEKFKKTYQGSEEELADLKSAYAEQKGRMDKIMEQLLCAEIEDEERLRSLLQEAIDKGELEAYDAFVNENTKAKKKRKRKAEKEASEAMQLAQELGIDTNGSKDSLSALLLRNRERHKDKMAGMLASLEARYSVGSKGRPKKRTRK